MKGGPNKKVHGSIPIIIVSTNSRDHYYWYRPVSPFSRAALYELHYYQYWERISSFFFASMWNFSSIHFFTMFYISVTVIETEYKGGWAIVFREMVLQICYFVQPIILPQNPLKWSVFLEKLKKTEYWLLSRQLL